MKKSMAVILLGSAMLMPGHHNAEAAYQNNDADSGLQSNVRYYVYQGTDAYQFPNREDADAFIKQYMDQLNSYFSSNGHINKPVTPQKPGAGTNVEKPQTPSKPQAPIQKPSKPQAPDVKPNIPENNNGQTAVEKPNPAPQAPSDASLSAVEKAVLDLTNVERQKAGLKPLQADAALMKSARAKSADMASKNYFSHTSPTYGSPFDQMKSFGISYRAAAENIAMGQRSPEEVVKAWMESPGHRQNILTPDFTHIGIGYDANGNYWTQQFISK